MLANNRLLVIIRPLPAEYLNKVAGNLDNDVGTYHTYKSMYKILGILNKLLMQIFVENRWNIRVDRIVDWIESW